MQVEEAQNKAVDVLCDVWVATRDLLAKGICERLEDRMRVRAGGFVIFFRVAAAVGLRYTDEIELGRETDDECLEEVGLEAKTPQEGERRPVFETLGFGRPWRRGVWE